ncbi:MAG: ATP-binding protein [Moraxellaceae bacterium]|nr:ATP-binding protein [Moraxellaceae bacterium]
MLSQRNIRIWLVPSLAMLLLIVLAKYVVDIRTYQARQADQNEVQNILLEVRAEFLSHLNANMYLGSGISAYIQANNGIIHDQDMQPWLQSLFKQGRYIRNIGIAPQNTISMVFPLKNNEAAVGLHFPSLPDQWPQIEQGIKTNQPFMQGPVNLAQGGRGLAYRIPVYLNNNTEYWGLISSIIDIDKLVAEATAKATTRGLDIVFVFNNDATQVRKNFTGSVDLPIENLTGQVWGRLTKSHTSLINIERLLAYCSAMLIGLFIFRLQCRDQQVLEMQEDLLKSQRIFSAAFSASSQGMLLLSPTHTVTAANPACAELLGMSAHLLQEREFSSLLSERSRDNAMAIIAASSSFQAPAIECELLHYVDQHTIECELHIASIEMGNKGWLVHIRDLRESKKLQQLQNEFISTTSHELRTPLTAIIGALGLLNNEALGPIPANMKELINLAYGNSQTLKSLINDLLDMDKLLSGHIQLVLQAHPIQNLVTQTVNELSPFAKKQNVTVTIERSDDLLVMVDALRFQQILSNLLSNAIKFSGADSTVTVHIRQTNNFARVAITDQGPGISSQFQARLFSRFAQEDASNTRNPGGTGLGLAISKALVEQMRGRIGYLPASPHGATFWFEMPLVMTNEF